MIDLKFNDHSSAETKLNIAFDIFEMYSTTHSEYNSIKINMGLFEVSKGNFSKAHELFKYSFLELTKTSPDHPDAGKALLNLIYVSIKLGQIELDYHFLKKYWNNIKDLINVNLLNETCTLNVHYLNTIFKNDFVELHNCFPIEMSNPILMFIVPIKYIR
jgi:hypothetical protein